MTHPDEFTQDEKRQVLENDKRVRERGTTYSTFAEAFADESSQGRFRATGTPSVTGATATPAYPAGPAWCAGDQGVEPPLNYSVDELQPIGEPHEIAASIAAQDAPPLGHSLHSPGQGDSGDPTAAPPNNPLIGGERVGSPPFLKEEE